MPIHEVREGESLNSIAFEYGFTWKYLWDLPENKSIKDKRGDPNVLYPGDEVFFPDKEEKQESGGTEARHKFELPGVPFVVRIMLLDTRHEPLAGAEWYFEIDGVRTETKLTQADGRIEQKVSAKASSVVLYINGRRMPLKQRFLNPANTVTGIQQRLANLGYEVGPVDGVLGPRTRAALRRFQIDEEGHELEPTGEPDEKTIKRLRQLHENVVFDDHRNRLPADELASGGIPPQDDHHYERTRSSEEGEDEAEEQEEDVAESEDDEVDNIYEEDSSRDFEEEADVAGGADRTMSVRSLQRMLVHMGYDPGPVDNIMKPRTVEAIKLFQEFEGLTVNGNVDPPTRAKLRRAYTV